MAGMAQVLAVQPVEHTYEPQQLLSSSMGVQPVYHQAAQIGSASSPSWNSVAPTATHILQPQYVQQPVLQVSQVQLQPPAAAVALALAQPGAQWTPQASAMPATVFFAGVTPVADSQRLRLLFSQFGRVLDLNLFRPYNGCRTSKGCGLVVFSQHSEAAAALETLNGRFVWPGARSPMVIEWCDPSKQHKKKRAQPLAHTLMIQHPAQLQHVQYVEQPMPMQQQHYQQQYQHQVQQPQQAYFTPSTVPVASQPLGVQVVYVNQRAY